MEELIKRIEQLERQVAELKKMPAVEKECFTVKELTCFLDCSENTIYSILQEGKLPAFKLGGNYRFYRKHLEDWMKSSAVRLPKR